MKHNVEIHKSQRELEKFLRKIEDTTGVKIVANKEGTGSASPSGQVQTTGYAHSKSKDTIIDNLGQGLKNVGANIREGITDLGGSVINKPRELATSINSALRHKRFGSADNIHHLEETGAPENGSMRGNGAPGRRDLHLVVDYSLGGPPSHPLGPSNSAQGLAVSGVSERATNITLNNQSNILVSSNKPSDDENSSLNSPAESLGGGGSVGANGGHVNAYRTSQHASPKHSVAPGPMVSSFPYNTQLNPANDYHGEA
jgi:hypothetical protein